MQPKEIKVRFILNAVSLAICLIGLGYCIMNAPTGKSWHTGIWVFGLLSLFWICLIVALVRLQKNNKK